jgi:hypothetical protein
MAESILWTHDASGFSYDGSDLKIKIRKNGAQTAPITYFSSKGGFSPYYDCPWVNDSRLPGEPPPPHGNFFCFPFGAGGSTSAGEFFKCHGDVAQNPWDFIGTTNTKFGPTLKIEIRPNDVGGACKRCFSVDEENNVIYQKAEVSGVNGRYPVGYHPNLRLPFDGQCFFSTSSYDFGQVSPRAFELYSPVEYYLLKREGTFSDLRFVPTSTGAVVDCSVFPQQEGFVDIIALYRRPTELLAWNVMAYPAEGYLWFSLKETSKFSATLLWMENKGRHHQPWNGTCQVLGIEDTCSYFAGDTVVSQNENPVSARGFPTAFEFRSSNKYAFQFIEGAIPISSHFSKVKTMTLSDRHLVFTSIEGEKAMTYLNKDFFDGE